MDRCARLLLAALLLALTGGLTSCSDSKPSCLKAGTCECTDASHCPDGEHCVDGACRRVTGPDLPTKGFGEACLQDAECISGLCLPAGPGNGQACTQTCQDEDCPEGWECKAALGADPEEPQALCVQGITSRLCQACSVNSQCNALGDACLELGEDFVCARDCSQVDCPAGYTCTDLSVEGRPARQCLPTGGACTCGHETIGLTRPCASSNTHGSCQGQQVCADAQPQPDWSACDAPAPMAETCNGEDDDCDGLVDARDPGVDSAGLPDDPPYPSCSKGSDESHCIGLWACQPDETGAYAWVCGATNPANELCNGLDDNCDGVADDPFIDAQGRYVRTNHCGDCGIDCASILPNLRTDEDGIVLPGAVTCQIRAGAPTCVPLMCAPDFYPFPEDQPTTCAALVSPACQPCSTDADCRISSDRCIPVGQDPGGHCAQSCEPASPYAGCSGQTGVQSCCPHDYLCELFQGQRLCLPEAGTCTCNAQRVGQTRNCLITGAAGELCQGVQTCLPEGDDYSWGECEQSDVVVEVCDYLDNNCNGLVDEGFRDDDGSYATDEHCGACNVNCPARWDPEFQHAIGGCLAEGGGFACHIIACTLEVEPAHQPCRDDSICEPGGFCDLQLAICQPDNPGGCPGGECTAACATDATCEATYGPGFYCDPASGTCAVEFQYHNPNGTEADGCECAQRLGSGPDEPDVSPTAPEPGWLYEDADCDGIDGQASTSLFVWSGTPRSRGTRDEPFATIAEALDAYDPNQHSAVLVAAGTYRENIELTSGLKLHGGYHPSFAQRDVVLFPSLILGSEPDHADPSHRPGSVHARGLSGRTVLSGFIVQGYDVNYDPPAEQAAPSSYAIYLRDCDAGLSLTNNWILGGRGGDSSHGATGVSGQIGEDGQPGLDSTECPNSPDCANQTSPGGTGGNNGSCQEADGRNGATSRGSGIDPQAFQGGGLDGRGGWNSTYINAMIDPDLCKYDCQVGVDTNNNGGDAQAGGDGSPGGGGAGCGQAAGRVVAGLFEARPGGGGAAGTAGYGGGGGGAGGAVFNANYGVNPPCTQGEPFGDLGGSGGGGGGGGCGGAGGRPGSGGGGSFGVFMAFSQPPASLPIVRGNRIRRGFGGAGGVAGGGGQGGLGGQGGDGGLIAWPAWCAGAGGRGGRGGGGGAGGGGGGGCGGVSYAIGGQHLGPADYAQSNAFETPGTPDTGGPGGAGGASPAGVGSSGLAGSNGAVGEVGVFP